MVYLANPKKEALSQGLRYESHHRRARGWCSRQREEQGQRPRSGRPQCESITDLGREAGNRAVDA